MGNLKEQALKKDASDIQKHELTDKEINYLKLLNLTLNFHTHKQQLMSAYLYYVCGVRLGYTEDNDLQFEIDLDSDDKILTVKVLPPIETAPTEA